MANRAKKDQSLKVAASNTLKTRVVKSKKQYTRKIKHKAEHSSKDDSAFLLI